MQNSTVRTLIKPLCLCVYVSMCLCVYVSMCLCVYGMLTLIRLVFHDLTSAVAVADGETGTVWFNIALVAFVPFE